MSTVRFVQGNEACALGALAAGLDFFAGYPITPSSEIAELLSGELPPRGHTFIQMEDEIASLCAVIGASLTGKKAMTATSGPGFSLMQEALGYAVMTEIPLVIVNVMRGGPSTGLPTQVSQGDVNQARWGIHGDHAIITLTAGSHQALFDNTMRAFNLAETFRTPVILLYDELIAHMREGLHVPEEGRIELVERLRTSVPRDVDYRPYLPREDGRLPMSDFGGVHRYNVTGLYHDMWGFPSTKPEVVRGLLSHIVEKIESREEELSFVNEYHTQDAETLLISYGSAARTARQTVRDAREKGVRMGLLELETLWPFPGRRVSEALRRVREAVVVEMNLGQVFEQVRRVAPKPERVFLANRIDGRLIAPSDVRRVLRIIEGKGVWA